MPELELTAGTISYEATGGDGPALVLLGGVVMAGSVWESLAPSLWWPMGRGNVCRRPDGGRSRRRSPVFGYGMGVKRQADQ